MKILNTTNHIIVASLWMLLMAACTNVSGEAAPEPGTPNSTDAPTTTEARSEAPKFCKGADISWLTEMEDSGIKFFYDDGSQGDCLEILKSKGVNFARLRLWVTPANKYNTLSDVIAKARRARQCGMGIMIDFHYSDDWADPAQQTIPSIWQGQDIDALEESLSSYTRTCLEEMKVAGIDVDMVQIGNETGNGMLWPLGQADKNPEGYARLTTAGYEAVKAVFPDAKVIVHVQNGQDASLFKWLFDILKRYNAKYDIIGMSLYPDPDDYMEYVALAKENMLRCIKEYDKDVMLCEVGMGNSYETQCKEFLDNCFRLEQEIPDGRYLGLLYWEPQVYNDWKGYRKGAFTSKGSPSVAMDAFSYQYSSVEEILAD